MARLVPELFGHVIGDRRNRAGILHQLAEQRAKQEQREELRQKPGGAAHKSLGPVGEQGLAGEQRRQHGRDGREQQHAPSLERQPDQHAQSDQNAQQANEVGKAHDFSTPRVKRRDRRSSGRRVGAVDAEEFIGAARPSALSRDRNSHSALTFDEAPILGEFVGHDAMGQHSRPNACLRRCPDRRPDAAARSSAIPSTAAIE